MASLKLHKCPGILQTTGFLWLLYSEHEHGKKKLRGAHVYDSPVPCIWGCLAPLLSGSQEYTPWLSFNKSLGLRWLSNPSLRWKQDLCVIVFKCRGLGTPAHLSVFLCCCEWCPPSVLLGLISRSRGWPDGWHFYSECWSLPWSNSVSCRHHLEILFI